MDFWGCFQGKAMLILWALSSVPFGVVSSAFVCPSPGEIAPCACSVVSNNSGFVLCQGANLTQASIDQLFPALISANYNNNKNGKDGHPLIHLEGLKINGSHLRELDLNSMVKASLSVSYDAVSINSHYFLEKITGPSLPLSPCGINKGTGIVAESLWVFNNNHLSNQGLSEPDFLRYFDPSSVRRLSLSLSKVVGGQFPVFDGSGSSEVEFLPGLASLSNLEQIDIYSTASMSYIGGGQFKWNRNLRQIQVFQNGVPFTIGDDAFLLDSPDVQFPSNQTLVINLKHSGLTTGSFNGSCSTFKTRRPTYIYLDQNSMDSVPRRIFEEFLLAHDKNKVHFYSNPIQCDSKVRWLKEQRKAFEYRVLGVNCQNDPGKTIFTSNLV